jgi:hypothetical protein
LAFIAYWGIFLFGYDTCVCRLPTLSWSGNSLSITSGVAGGVVQSKYFQIKFGVRPAEGPVNQSRIDNVSANVVSALQGGAFFGALSSAPVSGESCVFSQPCSFYSALLSICKRSFQLAAMSACASEFLATEDPSLRLCTG